MLQQLRISHIYTQQLNVNKNISGSIYEYKTIKTIDYGALRLANAQEERNMLERKKFEDEQQKKIASEIYENPLKAFVVFNEHQAAEEIANDLKSGGSL